MAPEIRTLTATRSVPLVDGTWVSSPENVAEKVLVRANGSLTENLPVASTAPVCTNLLERPNGVRQIEIVPLEAPSPSRAVTVTLA